MSVRQHALEEHVPALQGPFALASAEGKAESLLRFARDKDAAVALCTLWCAPRQSHRAALPA